MPHFVRTFPSPGGYTDHIEIDAQRLYAGEELIVDGHKFLVESMDARSWGQIGAPHAGSDQDTFGIVTEVTLKMKHAAWRRCPAVEGDDFDDGYGTPAWREIEEPQRIRSRATAERIREHLYGDTLGTGSRIPDALADVLTDLERIAERSPHPDPRAWARAAIDSLAGIWEGDES